MRGGETRARLVRLAWLSACLVPGGACEPAAREATQPVRLVERFNSDSLHGPRAPTEATAPVEWRFADVASGWGADLGVRELHREGARLVGVADSAAPLLLLTRVGDLGSHDRLHAVEVRARVSAGSRPTADTSWSATTAWKIPSSVAT